ncbi:MAG: hypothetical protein PHD46_04550 [Eubacteriales bacterium]|nr:hypothetical protein [Eubacteriales bacterium]
MFYGKRLKHDAVYGTNNLTMEWFNKKFLQLKKEPLTKDTWKDFIEHLKNYKDCGFERAEHEQIIMFFSAAAQYKNLSEAISQFKVKN